MHIYLDQFGLAVRTARTNRHITQKELADKLYMSVRTIIEIEQCHSSPKFETVILLARELNISLDAILFPETRERKDTVAKSVVDFFAGKSESEAQQYLLLCRQADRLKESGGS